MATVMAMLRPRAMVVEFDRLVCVGLIILVEVHVGIGSRWLLTQMRFAMETEGCGGVAIG